MPIFHLPSDRVILQHSSSSSSRNSITVNWNPIPCENRWPGSITYQSYLTRVRHAIKRSTVEHVSFENLKPCTTYTVMTKAYYDANRESEVLVTRVTTATVGKTVNPVLNLYETRCFDWWRTCLENVPTRSGRSKKGIEQRLEEDL